RQSRCHFEALEERAVVARGLESRVPEPRGDVIRGGLETGAAVPTPLEVVGCQELEVLQVGLRIDPARIRAGRHTAESERDQRDEQTFHCNTSSTTTLSRPVSFGDVTRSSPPEPSVTGQAQTGALVPLSRSSDTNALTMRRESPATASANNAAAVPSAPGPGGHRPCSRLSI